MARPVGSKNSKTLTFVFPNADNRLYFIKTQLPPDISYTVYTQPSLLNQNVSWFYLKFTLKIDGPNPLVTTA